MTRSLYADRDTVGTAALEALKHHDNPCAGDLGHELMPSLVEDLNNTIKSDPYDGKDFYITIHEKKDLQLKNVILRRMVTSVKRPYPETNTTVFWTSPKTHETLFCWSLPHWSNFPNYLLNSHLYVPEQIEDIKAFQSEKMERFGFKRVGETPEKVPIYKQIEGFKDRKMGKQKNNLILSTQITQL